ncbi:Response regulator receiver domain [Gaiella occulta]|uniref:histidine kinase n=1 Tax=Gaiella occulta TaxID=1002870 RepID=A0A7M2Z000_9ACTN|nr:response regulator [Gaiella occulta]RDI75718.1 Response regulator receiver domain [Gaiella occulta]
MTPPSDETHGLRVEFAEEVQWRLAALADAVGGPDVAAAVRIAHTLKGSSRVLALEGVAAAMERVEQALGADPPDLPSAQAAIESARAEAERELPAGAAAPAGGSRGTGEEAEAWSRLVSQLAHDLRTPLNAISGFARLLQMSEIGAAEREYVDAILQAAGELEQRIGAAADASAAARPAAGVPSAAAEPGAARPPLTVLCVEDDEVSGLLVRRVLERRPDVRLLVARGGEEGIAIAEAQRPDLVLLDLRLPDVDGEEVLRRLRVGPAWPLPVVIVSGDAQLPRAAALEQAGASGYLSKPVDVERLLALVDGLRAREGAASDPD